MLDVTAYRPQRAIRAVAAWAGQYIGRKDYNPHGKRKTKIELGGFELKG